MKITTFMLVIELTVLISCKASPWTLQIQSFNVYSSSMNYLYFYLYLLFVFLMRKLRHKAVN